MTLKDLIASMATDLGQSETARVLGLAQPTVCNFLAGRHELGLIALRTIVANKPDLKEAVREYWRRKL
jgi:predicted transcriptional regulator